MLRIISTHLWRRAGRSLAMVLAIMVATSGFTVLTASTSRSELAVVGQVGAHFRGAYDILVRPAGSRTALERDRGLLRPNFPANQYGGISMAQWRQIAATPDVDIAAPVASLGYAQFFGRYRFDLTGAIDPAVTRQIIRHQQVWRADRGLTTAVDAAYLMYVTKRPVIRPVDGEPAGGTQLYSDGQRRSNPCGGTFWPTWEVQEDGRVLPLCLFQQPRWIAHSTPALVAHMTGSGTFEYPIAEGMENSPKLDPPVLVMMSYSVQAVDPESEARLDGLDHAVVDGKYLPLNQDADPESLLTPPFTAVPTLATTKPPVDEEMSVRMQRVELPGAGLAGLSSARAQATIAAAPVAATRSTAAVSAYQIQQSARPGGTMYSSGNLMGQIGRASPVEYDVDADGTLHPRTAAPASSAWTDPTRPPPMLWTDNAVRHTTTKVPISSKLSGIGAIVLEPVGYFDPGRLTQFDTLAKTPLDTFDVDRITGADAANRARLGDQTLDPNSNPGGYNSPPPTFLISLAWLAMLTGDAAPISAVRVRVAGITGFDGVSRERVRLAAQRIAETTGLDVEITMGASPSAQTVVLPAGSYSRPQLRLSEEWTRKGVAALIVAAADRKSVALFLLILVVCVLFLANAVSAAVRDRSPELGILSCLGWRRWRVAGVIAGEVFALGVLAGALSALLAVPISRGIGAPVTWTQALWAVPVAIGVAIVAAAPPAWRGTRSGPLSTIRGTTSDTRLGRLPALPNMLGVSMANLSRAPGRTALGASALAVGVGGLTILAAITWTFHGTVTGSLLGDAVSLQVRGVDTIAVAATVLLGLIAVVDVQYLNVRDRAAELAVLRATGWTGAALGRLIAYEGSAIGLLGALLGAAVGLGATAWFAGGVSAALLLTAAAVAASGTALAVVASLAPAFLMNRASLTGQLAEE
jgi:putative ABC transport system permease protein